MDGPARARSSVILRMTPIASTATTQVPISQAAHQALNSPRGGEDGDAADRA
ncbi:hypothetical protein AB0K16_51420 [Nonomuraea jabiensis]|uniref:hypothetical protein n=1 Tax=Nonomuraea jabiensis TaxID=882448 RepID=UPI00342B8294